MKMRPLYPFCLACLAIGSPFYLYLEYVWFLGFPDGFVSELDGARETLVICFNWISIAIGIWFLNLARIAFRRGSWRAFLYSCSFYFAVVIIALAIDLYFRSHLMDNAGG